MQTAGGICFVRHHSFDPVSRGYMLGISCFLLTEMSKSNAAALRRTRGQARASLRPSTKRNEIAKDETEIS